MFQRTCRADFRLIISVILNKSEMSNISVRPLCPELEKKAQVELNETPKKLEEGIAYLKEWIAAQPHLRARTDDQWLAAFLRGSKHSLERAKEKIDLFYAMRSMAPELMALKYWDPTFLEISRSGFGLALPKRTCPSAPRIVIIRVNRYNPNKHTPMDLFAVAYAIQQISQMEDDAFVIAGAFVIIDLTGLTTDHFKHLTPTLIKKVIIHAQEASPNRLKGVYFIGMPMMFQPMFNLGMQLLNEKNKRKIYSVKNIEELHKYISKDVLPVEYGGNSGEAQEITDAWMKKIADYEGFFKEDLEFGTDETKRPEVQRTAKSLFGVEGSFRQLEFD